MLNKNYVAFYFMLLLYTNMGCNKHFINSSLKKRDDTIPQTIYLDTDTSIFRFNVLSFDDENAKKNYVYTWYKYNIIYRTLGGYDGRLLNGEYTQFYKNGSLKEKGFYRLGCKKGKWRIWYKNGQLKEFSIYKHGLKNGKEVVYDNTGKRSEVSYYRNGLKHGNCYYYNMDTIVKKEYYQKGEIFLNSKASESHPPKIKSENKSKKSQKQKKIILQTNPNKTNQIKTKKASAKKN